MTTSIALTEPPDGPCLCCAHVESNGVFGTCPKYDRRRVRALGGCLDIGQVVYFELDLKFMNALKGKPNESQHPTTPSSA